MNLYNKNKDVCFDVMDSFSDKELGIIVRCFLKKGEDFLLGCLESTSSKECFLVYGKFITKRMDYTCAFGDLESDDLVLFKVCITSEKVNKQDYAKMYAQPIIQRERSNSLCFKNNNGAWRKFVVTGSNDQTIGRAIRNAAIYSFLQDDYKSFFSIKDEENVEKIKLKNLILVTENVREVRKFRKNRRSYPKYFDKKVTE